MKTLMKYSILSLAVCLAAIVPARAALIIDIYEEAGNVVFDYSGSVDLNSTALDQTVVTTTSSAFTGPGLSFENLAGNSDRYTVGFTAAPQVGIGTLTSGSHTGDNLLIWRQGTFDTIYLPENYTSGEQISGKATFAGKTLADGGLTQGTSVTWTWTADVSESATFNVIPEPATLGLIGLFGGGILVVRRLFSA